MGGVSSIHRDDDDDAVVNHDLPTPPSPAPASPSPGPATAANTPHTRRRIPSLTIVPPSSSPAGTLVVSPGSGSASGPPSTYGTPRGAFSTGSMADVVFSAGGTGDDPDSPHPVADSEPDDPDQAFVTVLRDLAGEAQRLPGVETAMPKPVLSADEGRAETGEPGGNELNVVEYDDIGGPPPRTTPAGSRAPSPAPDEFAIAAAACVPEHVLPSSDTPPDPYLYDAIIGYDEDRMHEFKAVQRARTPVRRISDYLSKYLNSLINTNGGCVYFGVTDDGVIKGVVLNRSNRDDLRLATDRVLHDMWPPVDSSLIAIRFVPVLNAPAYPTFVVEFHIARGPAPVYLIGRNKPTAYIRRDSSTYVMPMQLILERMNAPPGTAAALGAPPQPSGPTSRLNTSQYKIITHGSVPSARDGLVGATLDDIRSEASPIKAVVVAGPPGIGKASFARQLVAGLSDDYPRQFSISLRVTPTTYLTPAEARAFVVRAFYPNLGSLPVHAAELDGLYLSCFHGEPSLLLLEDAPSAKLVHELLPSSACCVVVTAAVPIAVTDVPAVDVRLDPLDHSDSVAFLRHANPELSPDQASSVAVLAGGFPLALTVISALLRKRAHLPLEPLLDRLNNVDLFALSDSSLGAALVASLATLSHTQQLHFVGLATFHADFDVDAASHVLCLDHDAASELLAELHHIFLVRYAPSTGRYSLHPLVRKFVVHELAALGAGSVPGPETRVELSQPAAPSPARPRPSHENRPRIAVPARGSDVGHVSDALEPQATAWPKAPGMYFRARFIEYCADKVVELAELPDFAAAFRAFVDLEASIMHALEECVRYSRLPCELEAAGPEPRVGLAPLHQPPPQAQPQWMPAEVQASLDALRVVRGVAPPEDLMAQMIISGGRLLRARFPPATYIGLVLSLRKVLLAADPESIDSPVASLARLFSPRMWAHDATDSKLAAVHHELGVAYASDGQIAPASEAFEAALKLRRRLAKRLPAIVPVLTESLYEYGMAQLQACHYHGAHALLAEAAELGSSDEGSLVQARVELGLASVCREMAQYAKADALLRHALEVLEAMEAPDHGRATSGVADVRAACLDLVGQLRQAQGRYGQARRALTRALAIKAELAGPESAGVAATRMLLASVYGAESNYNASEDELEQALAIRRDLFGHDHPLVANTLRHLAFLNFYSFDDYERAESLYEQARDIVLASVGTHHAEYAAIINDMALIASYRHEYDTASALLHQALDIRTALFDENHPLVAAVLNNLGNVHRRLKDFDEAKRYLNAALAIRTQRFGEMHPETARTLHNVGMLHLYLREYDLAHNLLGRALEVRSTLLGPNHPEVASDHSALGSYWLHRKDLPAAEAALLEALRINKLSLGASHRNVLHNLSALQTVYATRHDYATGEPYVQEAVSLACAKFGVEHPRAVRAIKALLRYYSSWLKHVARTEPRPSPAELSAFSAARIRSALDCLYAAQAAAYTTKLEDELERVDALLAPMPDSPGAVPSSPLRPRPTPFEILRPAPLVVPGVVPRAGSARALRHARAAASWAHYAGYAVAASCALAVGAMVVPRIVAVVKGKARQ
ncbi:tetratricopeptide repeat family protein [Thecamonas trahens ATCC 50062]|uniref:Tetratricopeptide repeat family protein n=1 Tax=Thecamonas trahens ATCC 50062 TaxID=461836 RepID=A0A0L0DIN5_THETB|nr:tetratricopeptide repeat family protein [Thecamonas trahens ATCC 50062]KNC52157.1 tetratricopeptide repeat family protein [Thecamonas trahens ATCC 50062]|eukprot:XP_013762160.1 tetratricopeptide repeat family protein [Thecamonas trahens ATCC 50062]